MLFALIAAPVCLSSLLALYGCLLGRSGSSLLALLCHIIGSALALLLLYETLVSELPSRSSAALWLFSIEYIIQYGLLCDAFSSLLCLLIQLVLSAILLYCLSYMRSEPFAVRFSCLMSLFAFSMQLLIAADGPALLFFG